MKTIALIYGLAVYIFFLIVNVYFIGFMADLPVVKSIDSGEEGNIYLSLLIDTVLLSVFAFSHSIMARSSFKAFWIKIIPEFMERSTYVLISALSLVLLFYGWRPVSFSIWEIKNAEATILIWLLYAAGWLIATLSTFFINHFDLFGLRQVYSNFRGREYTQLEFKTAGLYNVVRHPIMTGFLIAFWATPKMSAGHLYFSLFFTVYIIIALKLEEQDLVSLFGSTYRHYMKRVPMLFPRPGRSKD